MVVDERSIAQHNTQWPWRSAHVRSSFLSGAQHATWSFGAVCAGRAGTRLHGHQLRRIQSAGNGERRIVRYAIVPRMHDNRYAEFDPQANVDDGSCIYLVGCGPGASVQYYGETYPILTIGEQCWFKKNLNTPTYRSGDAITLLEDGFVCGERHSSEFFVDEQWARV